jgi:tetratricopeptide (TPR) repeat protein
MSSKEIALTTLVKTLGYKDHVATANRIRDILLNKEHFKKEYVIEQPNIQGGRPEKTIVATKSKTLVDNLAILQQYSLFFGKASKEERDQLPAYRQLKQGVDEASFKQKIQKQNDKLKNHLRRSTDSLKNLPIFAKAILKNGRIDITQESLRELMEKAHFSSETLDFSVGFELGAWNELIELQDRLDDGENNTTLHLQIGEKLLSLGEIEQALESLKKSLELNPCNGVALALVAKTVYDILNIQNKEHYLAQARTEFSGAIANPINAEEHWLNERIEDTDQDFRSTRSQFIETATNALFHWPSRDNLSVKLSDTNEKPNFYYNLNHTRQTNVDFERRELFSMLLNEIEMSDFLQNKTILTEVFRSFQHWNRDLNPITNIYFDIPIAIKMKLIIFISWLSEEDIAAGVNELVKNWIRMPISASGNLKLLKSYNISRIFWKQLGKEKFTSLLADLETSERNLNESAKLSTLAGLQLNDVRTCFSIIINKHNILYRENLSLPLSEQTGTIELSSEDHSELEVAIRNSLNSLDGWQDYMDHYLWQTTPYSNEFPVELLALVFIAPLIEISNGHFSEHNTIILQEYSEHKHSIKNAIGYFDSNFIEVLIGLILSKQLKQEKNQHVSSVIDPLIALIGELAQEAFEESLWFE